MYAFHLIFHCISIQRTLTNHKIVGYDQIGLVFADEKGRGPGFKYHDPGRKKIIVNVCWSNPERELYISLATDNSNIFQILQYSTMISKEYKEGRTEQSNEWGQEYCSVRLGNINKH